MNKRLSHLSAGILLAGWGLPALAAINWSLGNANAPAETAWTASSNTNALSKGTVNGYAGGVGVAYSGESSSSPNHALDNQDRYESVLLDFGPTSVRLDSVSLGWTNNDSDIWVLAYTSATPFSGSLAGAKYSTLLSNGWSLVGNYTNVGTNTVNLGTASSLYSSFWLIGAGGFASSVGVTSGDKKANDTWKGFANKTYDYVKVSAVGGTPRPPPSRSSSVPEPGSLALLGVAFAGMLSLRRHPFWLKK